MAERREGPGRTLAAAALAALLAFAARVPALSLPLEGEPVAHAALAQSLAHGRGYAIDGVAHDRLPPLWAAASALPAALGARPTDAARGTALALGAAGAALLVLVAAALARGRLSLATLAGLAAAHPALALFAGGLEPGPDALALVLVEGAVLLSASPSRRAQGWGLGLGGLAPLARFEAVGFAAALLALAWQRSARTDRPRRARLVAGMLAFLPLAAWCGRTWIASGGPFGTAWPGGAPSLVRLPGNLLVLLAMALPAAGLGLLWVTIPPGLADLWRLRGPAGAAARATLAGSAAALLAACCFAGSGPTGERPAGFGEEGLRLALFAVPWLLVAGVLGLRALPARVRAPFTVAAFVVAAPLALLLVTGSGQRALPFGPIAAGRLHAVAEAVRTAAAESDPEDWIVVDLASGADEGTAVFLGDFAPGRRVGVAVAPSSLPRVAPPVPAGTSRWPLGGFPRPPVLPLVDEMPREGHALLVSDQDLEGVIWTGGRRDRGLGGAGIFHRAILREVDGGRAGTLRIHSVRRPR